MSDTNHLTAGADERTPSRSHYFTWINNTNEGSTEEQTLINIAYFGYLRREYGMQLDIYAWDAGNLDGADQTYERLDSPKIKAQYPNGYAPLAEAARQHGMRLGVWGGPDGFGDTPESAAARQEQMISLCRDFHFALFKFDMVCGSLAPEHQPYFVQMMQECRRYSPDLILLNHRLELGGEGLKHATTFLWQGQETYVDVNIANHTTAPHHRGYFATRGNVPGLRRLTEDHGVCISSCIDYFEDELVIQAFGRCLILAPEVYGNPWLMRDDEQARMARIYNLHRRHRKILVDGIPLEDNTAYPPHTVSRGSGSKRFICTGNTSWEIHRMPLRLDTSIGLNPCDRVTVIEHHPYEQLVGEFAYGDVAEILIQPFRACLIEVCDSREADVMLRGCAYEILHEDEQGSADRVRLLSSDGHITYTDGQTLKQSIAAFDHTLRAPRQVGEITADRFAAIPADADHQLEVACFVQDHDSLETRSLKRSGNTTIPEVQAARDAFFHQKTYRLRGTESRFAFDGRPDTFFDGMSKTYFDGFRIEGGCLRVDFGDLFDADEVIIECFDIDTPMDYEVKKQVIPPLCDYSADLDNWRELILRQTVTVCPETIGVVIHKVNNIVQEQGHRLRLHYSIKGAVRYFRMPHPVDRIYKIALVKDGQEVTLSHPRANNLLPYKRKVVYTKETTVTVLPEEWRAGCYLSVGLEGSHGQEGAYVVLGVDGTIIGAPDRAPSYAANPWENFAQAAYHQTHHYTYYFPIRREWCGKPLTVRVLGLDAAHKDYGVSVYLCDTNTPTDGVVLDL